MQDLSNLEIVPVDSGVRSLSRAERGAECLCNLVPNITCSHSVLRQDPGAHPFLLRSHQIQDLPNLEIVPFHAWVLSLQDRKRDPDSGADAVAGISRHNGVSRPLFVERSLLCFECEVNRHEAALEL